jgi:putative transposase
MDFVSDQLYDERRFRVLNVMDDFRKEMVGQLAELSIPGCRVARILDQVADARDMPPIIVCDIGPEFISKAMFMWAKEKSVKLGFIQPGKPTQNAFIESLNGKFRNECLNQHWFRSLEDVTPCEYLAMNEEPENSKLSWSWNTDLSFLGYRSNERYDLITQ